MLEPRLEPVFPLKKCVEPYPVVARDSRHLIRTPVVGRVNLTKNNTTHILTAMRLNKTNVR